MNRFFIGLFIFFVMTASAIQAEKSKTAITYRLVDLGASKGEIALAPKLNDRGEIIANRETGGFIRRSNGEFFTPHIPEAIISFHAINTNGDILVSTNYSNGKTEWSIWDAVGEGSLTQRKALPTNQIKEKFQNLCFCGLSETKFAAGYYLNKQEAPQIVVWDNENQKIFTPAISEKNKSLVGTLQGINSRGTVYGFFVEDGVLKPAVWHVNEGFSPMKHYRPAIVPEGVIMPESLAMTQDGVVYGTYWVEHKDASPIVAGTPKIYYNYAWKPSSGEYKQINIDGMLVTKVNNAHTLIGTLNGKSAICLAGKKPAGFASLIQPEQQKEWEIIHISDINDSNHLVGIGKFEDSIHLFYAEPVYE